MKISKKHHHKFPISIRTLNTRGHVIVGCNRKFVSSTEEEKLETLSDLMSRDTEILQLVLAGRTNKAFAAQISISGKTVQFHLNKIYTKIGRERA